MYTKEKLLERRTKLSESNQKLLKKRLQGNVDGEIEFKTTIPRRSGERQAPLSFLQERLLFLFEWEPESPIYNEAQIVRIKGKMDVKALERACLEIMRRHEILRTVYQYRDGIPVQTIIPYSDWLLPVIDLSGIPADVREAEVQWLTKHEANRPFDLRQEFSWRVILARVTEDDNVLFITQHHISCDGWSINLRNNEMTILYAAFAAGKPSPLPELPIQYADFACWQRQQLQGSILEKSLAYWRKQLANFAPLSLPTDRRRSLIPTSNGATQHVVLPSTFTKAIKAFSQQSKFTGFTITLTVFKTLLYRYIGQTDIAVGTLFANRDQPELGGLIGFFIETIVLRTDLSGNPTFRELLDRVYRVSLEAYAHQGVSLDQLISELQPKGNSRQDRPIRILFDWQEDIDHILTDLQSPADTLNEFTIEGEQTYADAARLDIWISIRRQDEDLILWGEYNTDLFNSSTISRLFGHFQTLLDGALTNPDMRISDLPLLTMEEQRRIMYEWNETEVAYPPMQCVHEMFEAQVGRTPDAVAIVFEDQCLTYYELNQRANQLANHLRSLGIGPEMGVGLCMERTPEMIVGLLGVLKAGGVYVPLDPLFPPERSAFILQDVQASALLTQRHLLEEFSAYEGHILCLDTDSWYIEQGQVTNVTPGVTVNHLAYVVYTSGSTGKPKGVAIQHNALANYITTAQSEFALGSDDRVLQFASISFDTAAEEIYPCLTSGATLVLRTDAMFGLATTFLRTCREWGITVLDLPTAYWHELTASLDTESIVFPEKVRLVIIGGERALRDRFAKWQEYIPQSVRLINTYGPTEATIVAVANDLTTLAVDEELEVPIGYPISNVQVYILDNQLQPVPIGIPGELHISGAGLARAYFNRSGLTAQCFIPNPFSAQPGTRLYKTGDQALYRQDGRIEFVGRIDTQIKIRGYRVEPGEIEAKFREHPAVQDVAVVAWEDVPDNKYLVAYVVADKTNPLVISDLRPFLQQTLPDYMLPATTMLIDALPLTPSGKIDRRALPAPDHVRPELESVYVAPRTLSEEILADIWSQVLGVDRVGVLDNFFELGGHSMLAIQLMARLQDAFEVELSLRLFFQRPTIAELAVAIDEILLKEIEDLSEDEVLQLLEDEL